MDSHLGTIENPADHVILETDIKQMENGSDPENAPIAENEKPVSTEPKHIQENEEQSATPQAKTYFDFNSLLLSSLLLLLLLFL